MNKKHRILLEEVVYPPSEFTNIGNFYGYNVFKWKEENGGVSMFGTLAYGGDKDKIVGYLLDEGFLDPEGLWMFV